MALRINSSFVPRTCLKAALRERWLPNVKYEYFSSLIWDHTISATMIARIEMESVFHFIE